MIFNIHDQRLINLVRELCKRPKETEWIEFKVNNDNPQEIGEYISALANAAALANRPRAYLIWRIQDENHRVVGTRFVPSTTKKGNEELESWLLRLLEPKINFQFFEVTVDDQPVVLLEIAAANRHPVRFSGQAYIRVGTAKKNLKAFQEKERALWRSLDQTPFENDIAIARAGEEQVVQLIDYPAYFDLMQQPLPETRSGVLEALEADDIIRHDDSGRWNITNVGAILFAKKLSKFPSLRRKAVRVIQYKGNSRIETIREQEDARGYASGFEGLILYISGLLPSSEVIEQVFRRTVPMYPDIAIRELVANTLIHQDFSITGSGPMVEIFEDRMEITNPGQPLIDTNRFLDSPPKSRNESLASLMRRMRICEERGTGIDKVVFQTEYYQLPPPIFEVVEESTRSVLLAPRPLIKMDKEDRIRACYLHSCLRYASREFMTNATIRKRFGIEEKNRAASSRLIKEAIEADAIKPYDASAAPKLMKYVPFWVQ
ncbi:ATP-binding protein [cf. Phormidesmis sp. LEGE 11477]|uniref:ATP-binding protein n=1 Tax=cf. Phormidesmis sp. LEGE 11477 TaxID=1828680 RepID=UPI00187EE35E|nr:ATP-binding protein [cf. Phormidesmis sp. LEGE 11477]MBE9061310.1 putative DNA binding domain-containing protein [cf. Phormidesmis sp. LEGE 11477]